MSPWDRFRLQWHDIPDSSGSTSACGDTRIHDEVMVRPGDIRGDVVAVLAHGTMRQMALLYTRMRFNNGPWRPVMNPHNRTRIGALVNAWTDTARYRK